MVSPDHEWIPDSQEYFGWRWIWYQALRFLCLWGALHLDALAFGVAHAAVTGALAGLAFRFDYWSNCVELLAASLVCSAGVLHFHWGWYLAGGFVLGFGRETLPLLALAGGLPALAVGLGSVASSGAVRLLTRTATEWETAQDQLQWGHKQWRHNLSCLVSGQLPGAYADPAIYYIVAALAIPQVPVLGAGLVAVTFLFARTDEPRVLTMLCPFAASTLVSLWR